MKKFRDQLEEFEIKFILFLSDMGYMKEDIFSVKFKDQYNRYRREFERGWNHGYK